MDVISTVKLDALSTLDASELPTEFRLFQFGDNPTSKGTFKLDEAGAKSVMDAYKLAGVELALDYEHQTFEAASNGKPAPAAGWFVPASRPDGIYATNVRWTPRAAEMLKGREYRYFSPTFTVDKQLRITRILNVALTNFPATKDQPALIAASAVIGGHLNSTTETRMPNLGTIVGLKDDASEDAVTERVISLARIENRLLEATGKDNIADAMTVVLANKDAASERDTMKKMCREWEERHAREQLDEKNRQIDVVIQQAVLDGRVSLRDTERLTRWKNHGDEFGVEQLKKLVAERDPRPVRAFQAPTPGNTEAAQLRALADYQKANPGVSTLDAYTALTKSNPALFNEEA